MCSSLRDLWTESCSHGSVTAGHFNRFRKKPATSITTGQEDIPLQTGRLKKGHCTSPYQTCVVHFDTNPKPLYFTTTALLSTTTPTIIWYIVALCFHFSKCYLCDLHLKETHLCLLMEQIGGGLSKWILCVKTAGVGVVMLLPRFSPVVRTRLICSS